MDLTNMSAEDLAFYKKIGQISDDETPTNPKTAVVTQPTAEKVEA